MPSVLRYSDLFREIRSLRNGSEDRSITSSISRLDPGIHDETRDVGVHIHSRGAARSRRHMCHHGREADSVERGTTEPRAATASQGDDCAARWSQNSSWESTTCSRPRSINALHSSR